LHSHKMQIKNKLGIEFKLDQRVDSPGDAGIASYRQAFFSPEYVAKYPDRADQVEKLKKAIEDQVRLLQTLRSCN